ncbi:TetR/AcrR family transcriptional regulator [Thermoactinomyces mirandus]|uniref:TetR/AcrR family transcriptional regulator n=1 Tax=Thermoactinomyces mirandus TaxID=2756294 RepID=A0A7W1XRW0_9BACL|nr:TetR/AcrR family transcriptional regulator [Thermoactinomyces mirandus]MBA4601995.1 TetR/AcrR family transcriptional regulator [Thermoactinomyces mirandus]
MSPLNKEQLEQIRVERKQQIKQAALKVFAQEGFAGTKTSMIASNAGISEGLIYKYFRSKDELYSEIIEELIEHANNNFREINNLPGTPFEQIKVLTEGMLDRNNKYAFMLILKAQRDKDIPGKSRQMLKQHFDNALIDQLIPIFVKGQELGEFVKGDPQKILSWYLYIINSLIMQDVWEEQYAMPTVEMLMRFLSK